MQKITIISLVGLFFVVGCVQDMALIEKGNVNAARKILIAGQSSEFKQDVIIKVMETLGTKEYYFKIIGLNQLDKEETEQYGVILLVNTYMAGHIDGRVTRILQDDPTNPKIIVFYTIGDENNPPPDWAKPDIKVDAVTSASLSDRVTERADQLVAFIEKRF